MFFFLTSHLSTTCDECPRFSVIINLSDPTVRDLSIRVWDVRLVRGVEELEEERGLHLLDDAVDVVHLIEYLELNIGG